MAIPTITDKVILVDFSLAETNAFALQEIDTQRQFSATDRGTAFIGFKAETIANGMTADISLANLDDDSRVNRTFTVTTGTNFDAVNKIFYYQIPDDEIVHWGNWIGYGKFTEGATSKVWTGRKFKYSISRDITNDPETRLIVMEDVNSFLASMAIVKSDLEADHAQAQADHANYSGLLEDGVLTTQIIAKLTELETTYAPEIVSLRQQLEQVGNSVTINPDMFSGTDAQKVQAAIDYALTNFKSIQFARMFDITGSTLKVNRGALQWDRRQLYLIGVGGGLRKTDSGFIFTSDIPDTGDVNVSTMKFEGGVGVKVYDGDKLIRLTSTNNEYRNVDSVLSAPNRWTQSMYFIKDHIIAGGGWKFEAKEYLDTTIQNCLIEDCDNGIRNTEAIDGLLNRELRIVNNVIENLKGKTMELGSFWIGEIGGNHIELNDEYIDLATLNSYGHYGLTIRNNHFNVKPEQVTAKTPCIALNKTDASGFKGQGGCISFNNGTNGALYELTLTGSHYIAGFGDHGEIIGSNYIQLGKPYEQHSGALRTYGLYNYFSKQYFTLSCAANTPTKHTITLPFNVARTMQVTVNTSNRYCGVTKVVAIDGSPDVDVTFYNETASPISINPTLIISYFGS